MKRLSFLLLLLGLSFLAYSQDSKIDRFSYSISWTPIYYGPNDGEFRFDAIIPLTFEARIHYSLVKRLSLSSGLGFQEWHESNLGWGYWSIYDPTKSEKWGYYDLRIPLQMDFFLSKENKIIKTYIKSEFVNEFGTNWTKRFQDDIMTYSDSFKTYNNSLYFGLGAFIKISSSINILTEGSIGTHLYKYPFDGYQIKLKLGIMIK
jgi:hypothetical protein